MRSANRTAPSWWKATWTSSAFTSAGVTEVVAICGTALTNQQVRALKRHSEHIVVNFDPDAAGSNAAERSIQMLLEESMQVRVLELDGGLDPDEYVKEQRSRSLRERSWTRPRATSTGWPIAPAADTTCSRSKAGWRACRFLLPAIQRISDKLERMAVANDVAGYLGVDPAWCSSISQNEAAGRVASARPPAAPVPYPRTSGCNLGVRGERGNPRERCFRRCADWAPVTAVRDPRNL